MCNPGTEPLQITTNDVVALHKTIESERLAHAAEVAGLHRRLEAAKAEGAAEAYEAEAAYWEEMRERALSMAAISTSYQFRRRRDEARERAAALRKQVQG